MKHLPILFVLTVALAVSACTVKPAPHKLTQSAPGADSAPTVSSW
jgi:hypothetical protein